jgi:hypothetical protein
MMQIVQAIKIPKAKVFGLNSNKVFRLNSNKAKKLLKTNITKPILYSNLAQHFDLLISKDSFSCAIMK